MTWAATCTGPASPQVGWEWVRNSGVPVHCHPLSPIVTVAVSPLSCCHQHSEEVCESCVVKTTLTAENAVEANKLSNNYKVGACDMGWGTHVCT